MSLKFTGSFAGMTGAVSAGDLTSAIEGWVINLTDTLLSTNEVLVDSSTPLQLNTPGEYTVEVVSAHSSPLLLKAWGAGGGRYGGGLGSYVQGDMTPEVGNIFKIWVGGGGTSCNGTLHGFEGGFGGGGNVGKMGQGGDIRGSGGGLSGIFNTAATHANSILIAAGGGGGSWDGTSLASGGYGAYPTGEAGIGGGGSGGQGGTQSTGGARGNNVSGYNPSSTAGTALQGGDGAATLTTAYSGSGGGGGYYGGGAGGGNNPGGGAGGGGSSYYNPAVINNFTFVNDTNTDGPAPNNTDEHYMNDAGMGSNLVATASFTVPAGLFVLTV